MAKPRVQGPRLTEHPLVSKMRREFPMRLAELRGERSQRAFAHDLGTYQQNINRYEKTDGTQQAPHADFLVLLWMKTGASIDWLLLGRGKPPKKQAEKRQRASKAAA